ncbi:hypothetical protein JOD29_003418 [Lysinibacillus composti]|nr:hypothetical protein [Lysinibacillus composti]MBM7610139.1 hypothetical protein [Lysinibacillus composti]
MKENNKEKENTKQGKSVGKEEIKNIFEGAVKKYGKVLDKLSKN